MASILSGYKKIFSSLDKKEKSNLYLLKGREKFIMEQFERKIASSVQGGDGMNAFNLSVAYGRDVDIEEFISAANSFPFMGGKKVLVLRELEKMRGSCKKLAQYCEDPVESSIVVIVYNTHDQTGRRIKPPRGFNKLEEAVKKNGDVIRFRKLNEGDLRRWIIQKAKTMGVKISSEASKTLVERIGENIYDLKNELDKLAVVYEDRKVDIEDLRQVIGNYRFNGIYDLIDRLGPQRESEILEILFKIINSGAERPSVIVYNLIRNFITLLKIKYGYKSGGYWYAKRRKQANSFTKKEIILWLENLRMADLKIKRSSLPQSLIIISCFLHSFENEVYEADSSLERLRVS
ncbi:MAG TPA: DNA polymerase III subunit delta [Candidatus Krumholzibacteriaceae bacterium]|nr:DNA polymerase III subunit delta [Candidatus Krumholzibacteriaceae bacterium]